MAATQVLDIILPKRKSNPKGIGQTPTFNENNTKTSLSVPDYRDHLTDIFDTRQSTDARALLQSLFRNDPDVSASVNAYLTVASAATPWWIVYDQDGKIDTAGHDLLNAIMASMFGKNDYSLGFQLKPGLDTILNEFRYMLLLRGGIGAEEILDKNLLPIELRHIDLSTVEWKEPTPGALKPVQKPAGSSREINLDIPSFFVAFYKRDPTGIYSYSPFVSAINTIAARQQVVNDLYRIMRKTGYPRLSVSVVEEVLRKNAPADIQADQDLMRAWLNDRFSEIASTISNLSVDQAFVHSDAVTTEIMNEKAPGMSMDVSPIIDVLNAQNQAALKTMATIIGRGESGVNTASVESRVFAMHADSLNQPIAELMSQALTLALRLSGSLSRVEFGFDKVELRPELELEPQKTMKQNRLLLLLSHGLISDDDFHIELFNRPRPNDVPEMSGTGFMSPMSLTEEGTNPDGSGGATADPAGNGQKQSGSLDRSLKPKGSGMAKSSASSRRAP